MVRDRSRVILLWFVVVLLVSGSWVAVGASPSSVAVSSQAVGVRAGNWTLLKTGGSLTPLRPRDYSNFTVLGGKTWEVKLLKILFSSHGLQMVCPHLTMPVVGLDFQVNYSKVLNLPKLRHRYGSLTIALNASKFVFMFNKAHSLIVHGFTGVFEFDRARLLKHRTARFDFVGIAQSVTIIR